MNISAYSLSRQIRVAGFGADPTMDRALIARYQPGGDLYQTLSVTRGTAAANQVAAAANSGQRESVTTAMANLGNPGSTGSTSIIGNFISQITTDPLQAPIAAAMGQGSSGPGLGKGTTSTVIKGAATIGIIALVLYGVNTFRSRK